ncbi:hypothetical protein CMK18_21400 [Candidatus Poribacteria bacterium]|nr:hypothetical protein [Candidatus Poribacteria bacterium]
MQHNILRSRQGIGVSFVVGTLMWKFLGSRMLLPQESSIFQTWTGALLMGAGFAGLMYYVGTLDMKV